MISTQLTEVQASNCLLSLKGQFTRCDLQKQLVGPTCSDNLVSLTQLTNVGAIFAFTQYDISCMLQVVTTNRIV